MTTEQIETTSWSVPRHLFDYSNVASFSAGKGPKRQFFAFDLSQLCQHSAYFQERAHLDHSKGRTGHFELEEVDPAVLACMLYWYRGWECSSCSQDRSHIEAASSLAEEFAIPLFAEHLARKMEALDVDRNPKQSLADFGSVSHLATNMSGSTSNCNY